MPAPRTFDEFPCSKCGGKLEFNANVGKLKCIYCGHEEEIPDQETVVEELSYEDFLATQKVKTVQLSETAMEVSCPGCRARITFEPPDVAGKCPFCGTSIVSKGEKAHPVIEPGGVIPCKITQKAAREKVRKWLGNNWFLPSALKELAQQEGMQGVYLPYWTYDAQTESHYTGSRGEYYYTTESHTYTDSEGETVTETREVQHTHWYPVSGTVSHFFDDVLIPATKQLEPKRLDRLSGWNLTQVVPYSPSYLAGFKAQRYQVPLETGLSLAKDQMRSQIHRDVEQDIGGDTQTVNAIQTQHYDITFKHILLPVWLSAYRYNNKQYQVMVNAQTGQITGDRPYSKTKIAIAIFAGITLVVGGFYLFTQLKNGKSSSRYRRVRTEHVLPNPISVIPVHGKRLAHYQHTGKTSNCEIFSKSA